MPPIIEALDIIDWFRAAFAGWRFLFSTSYRREMKVRWECESWYYVGWDVVCGMLGIAFTLLLGYLILDAFVV